MTPQNDARVFVTPDVDHHPDDGQGREELAAASIDARWLDRDDISLDDDGNALVTLKPSKLAEYTWAHVLAERERIAVAIEAGRLNPDDPRKGKFDDTWNNAMAEAARLARSGS